MIEVTCGIILKEDKILVTQRSEKMKLPLKWEFPGGKVEVNETEENCLLREIKEELNIEIKLLKRLNPKSFNYPTFSIRLIPFLCTYISGDICLAEHKDYKWLSKEDLKELDWAEADIPILDDFLQMSYGTRTL